MRGQLEVAPAGIPGKAFLQQQLQVPVQVSAYFSLSYTDHRDGLTVLARLAHTPDFSARRARPGLTGVAAARIELAARRHRPSARASVRRSPSRPAVVRPLNPSPARSAQSRSLTALGSAGR